MSPDTPAIALLLLLRVSFNWRPFPCPCGPLLHPAAIILPSFRESYGSVNPLLNLKQNDPLIIRCQQCQATGFLEKSSLPLRRCLAPAPRFQSAFSQELHFFSGQRGSSVLGIFSPRR